MDFYWPITVHSTDRRSISTRFGDGIGDSEIMPRTKRAVGFCTNQFCFGRPDRNEGGRYFVSGVRYSVKPDDCCRCNELQFGIRNHKRAAPESGVSLTI